jgi:hypothetical protein
LNDIGGFNWRGMTEVFGLSLLSGTVWVDASTYTGFGLAGARPLVFVELPEVLRATPWLCSRWRADGEGSVFPERLEDEGFGVLRLDPALVRFRLPLCSS